LNVSNSRHGLDKKMLCERAIAYLYSIFGVSENKLYLVT
jgi:hypothetical protein